MSMPSTLFPRSEGLQYLTEGGTETEIMFRHGHSPCEFAMFELMDNPAAVDDLKDMYQRYLEVAARYEFGALMAGFDYRASPDWGYSAEGLLDMQQNASSSCE